MSRTDALLAVVPPWYDDALCAQTDPEAFFPEHGRSPNVAKKVCQNCDVRDKCLTYALEADESLSGVWGGTSEIERRKIRRQRKRGAA